MLKIVIGDDWDDELVVPSNGEWRRKKTQNCVRRKYCRLCYTSRAGTQPKFSFDQPISFVDITEM